MTKKEMAQEIQFSKNAILSYVRQHCKDKKSQIAVLRGYIKNSADNYKQAHHVYMVQKETADMFKAELAGRRAALKELQKNK